MKFSNITDTARDALSNMGAFAGNLVNPTIRLGVTGLARSGKTVFITSLINNLVSSGRLPFFNAAAEGRITAAYLEPQPDDNIPRFEYEAHLAALTGEDRHWPQSTKRISQLRLTIEYEPTGFLRQTLSRGKLHVDIVDYPGEWLLDLPLLDLTFEEWSASALAMSREPARVKLARDWHGLVGAIDPNTPQDEALAQKAAALFTAYLKRCRADDHALSTVPPGRFLMPGELAGSPALTFSPLDLPEDGQPAKDSQWAMMARRFEAYKRHVVKPFFRDHFARLDRQIVLVDAMAALNAGPQAVSDLERALTDILASFRPGANSWLSAVLARRIDRIVFAATKADHLHHENHDRLEAILERITAKAMKRAAYRGAQVKTVAIAAVRATREAEIRRGGARLESIVGTPLQGERMGKETFDGEKEIAIFPGDLPDDPEEALATGRDGDGKDVRFIRFRPPLMQPDAATGALPALPHIRLDRAIEFLIGDRLE